MINEENAKTSQDIITVEFRHEGDKIKGRIVRDQKCREKIVFIERANRGSLPANGETLDVEVVRDTKPQERRSGALIVRLREELSQDGLTADQAKVQMLKLIRASGPIFGERTIEVDLPGWRGRLDGSMPSKLPVGPLIANWTFSSYGARRDLTIASSDGGIVQTRAVIYHETRSEREAHFGRRLLSSGFEIVDLATALKDLGPPAEVNASEGWILWRDAEGKWIRVRIDAQIMKSAPATYEEPFVKGGAVKVTMSRLNGAWKTDETIASGESLHGTRDGEFFISHAQLTDCPSHLCEQVIGLLRTTLHSRDWLVQQRLRLLVSREEGSERGSAWCLMDEVQQALCDPSATVDQVLRPWYRLQVVHDEVAKLEQCFPRYEGVGDPAIYGAGIPDDSAEVSHMRTENYRNVYWFEPEVERIGKEVNAFLQAREEDENK